MSAPRDGAGFAGDRRQSLRSALTLWALGYVIAGIALATAAAWPLYASPRVLLVGFIGGGLGVAVAFVARMLRWSVPVAGLVAIATYLLSAVPLALPSAMTSVPSALAGVRDAVWGVVTGWKQLLTLTPPLGEYQAVLVPFLVVMLFGGFLATLSVLSSGRRALWAVPVIAAMSVFGTAFGPSAPSTAATLFGFTLPAPREVVLGVAVFLISLLWVIGRARLQRAQALRAVAAGNINRRATPIWITLRRRALSGALVLVALVAGIAVAPVAAGWSHREVLRDGVEPIVAVQEQPSPLGAYRGWFSDERIDETVVQLTGDPGAVDRVRLVTLDAYDGEQFQVSPGTRFSRLPRAAASTPGQVELDITIGDGYRGIWVPAPAALAQAPTFRGERAEQLADGFHIDDGADTAITIAEAPGGEQGLVPGDRYTVLVDPTGPDAGFTAVQGGASTLDAEQHPALVEWAALQEQPRTGAGFLELVDRLRARGYLSHGLLDDDDTAWISALQQSGGYTFAPSYAGHSTARLEELFGALLEQQQRAGSDAPPEQLVAGIGDDEQFAAAAALLARHWGLESRVVIGARLAGATEVAGIVPCTETCTGASMSAWIEVRVAGAEWTAIDVTPQHALLPSTITEGERPPQHPTVPEQPRPEELDPPQAQSDSDNDAPPLEAGAPEWAASLWPILRAGGIGLLAALLLVLPLLVLLIAKRLRRSSRSHAEDPEVRLAGAWEELVDLYTDHGVPMDAAGTRETRAESTGRPAAARLAVLVDAGVFAAHPPAAAQADEAWEIVAAERRALAASDGRWRTFLSRATLASLLARVGRRPSSRRRARRRPLDTLAVTGPHGGRQKEDA